MEPRKARITRRAAVAEASVADAPGIPPSPAHEENTPPDVLASPASPADAAQGGASVARVGYAPIVRVDAARREIELCATSEALDSYGTVFDYAASKDAFTRWIGNVREMHERRAVGSRVGVRCDDEQRKVYVRVRVSHGAADTWEKVLDGTLRGASIGASNVVWERQTRRVAGRERLLNVATRYDLVELSLVDSPSNPDALGISIVRDAVPDAAVLDDLAGDLTLGPSPCAEREAVWQDDAMDAVGALPAAPAAAELEKSFSEQADDSDAPPELRIARQAAAHGWAVVAANRGTEVSHSGLPAAPGVPQTPASVGTLPAHETSGLKPSLV
ncbi:MAG TPA: hypothetical protein VKT52_09005, partial [Ktedonobacterales bacterium]|nr:hypothetical protein [Ktedonobacterales bacterium]